MRIDDYLERGFPSRYIEEKFQEKDYHLKEIKKYEDLFYKDNKGLKKTPKGNFIFTMDLSNLNPMIDDLHAHEKYLFHLMKRIYRKGFDVFCVVSGLLEYENLERRELVNRMCSVDCLAVARFPPIKNKFFSNGVLTDALSKRFLKNKPTIFSCEGSLLEVISKFSEDRLEFGDTFKGSESIDVSNYREVD